ncbi:HET domain protein [Metarhizium brunneum]
MDIFAEPDDPIQTTQEQTPYLCIEHWDGGMFRTYGYRKHKTSIIPVLLRVIPDMPTADQPYLENLYPTPKEELQPFMQTWLYFGMLAELLGLNEIAPGVRLVEESAAKEEISKLHKQLTREENGRTVLTATEILTWGPLFLERLQMAENQFERLVYILQCLHYAMVMLQSTQENIDHAVRYSIAALGELFTTGIYAAASSAQPRVVFPHELSGISWYQNYICPGGVVEKKMLSNGWCPSEIEKIRSQLQGLYTMHYTSQLKKPTPWLDHSSCGRTFCDAFRIDMSTYKPAHVHDGCGCEFIEADPAKMAGILRNTDGFPLVRVEGDLDDLKIVVEEFEDGVSYVALSHVWANGLGNPTSNSLPRCQIARISKLIDDLPKAPGSTESPRLWLDTLCCPVEAESKMICLERIADVYRKAHHVLVLDTTLTAFKYEGTSPAELLVRAFGCSPWMRRLWTLQEGALARTLQIQYADKAGNNITMLTDLWMLGSQDSRYMRIFQDVLNEFNQLLGFSPKTGPENANLPWQQPQITTLQRTLNFRTVSVPADEALCISTLMKLDTRYIAAGKDASDRMKRMWEKLSEANGGISARLLFYLDEQLDIDGWRWAPRSLLASAVHDPVLSMDERVMRFHTEKPANASDNVVLGTPTPIGLKVRLPGYRVVPVPLLPNFPLHAWPEVIHSVEDSVIAQNERTGRWFRIIDWYRSRKIAVWTREQRREHDRREDNPLCRAIHTGKCCLIMDKRITLADGTTASCLVQADELHAQEVQEAGHTAAEKHVALKAVRERAVILSAVDEREGKMLSKIKDLAISLAEDPVTEAFLQVQKSYAPGQEEWEAAELAVRRRMKKVVEEAWYADEEFRQTMRESTGDDLDDYVWVFVPKLFSHAIWLRELPERQLWFVD